MDSNGKKVGVSSQESVVRSQKTGVRSEKWEGGTSRRFRLAGILLATGYWLLATCVYAQTVNLGGTGALGGFINPLTVTVSGTPCTYTLLQIDLVTGAVGVTPARQSGGTACPSQTLATNLLTLADLFNTGTAPPASFASGVVEVTDFNLRQTVAGTTSDNVTLEFLPNADNTPVIIRATGNVTINGSQTLSVNGRNGTDTSGTSNIVRGTGGRGGPGGYRGGDGGNGGVTPTPGMSGFGPGGGLGGPVGGQPGGKAGSAKFLTVGVTLPSTPTTVSVPTTGGTDLATQLRGGSGGGGGGGITNGESGRGGSGGGGAILIAANNTITVNGTITARGGSTNIFSGDNCNMSRRPGSPGTGGTIRLAAFTIAGSGGGITVAPGDIYQDRCDSNFNGFGSDAGIIRLEAYNITITSTLTGPTAAASAPGLILVPTDAPSVGNPFIRFARIKDASNANNCSSLSASDSPCTVFQGSQTAAGRTGLIPGVDATMPSPAGIAANTVNIDFIVGPIPGFPTSPTNPNLTLVVAPVDPAQGAAKNYQAAISLATDPTFCPTSACKTSVPNVTLPTGFSSMSAFVVLNLTSSSTLARMFPKTYQGEEIQDVRLETTGSDTKYILIAKSGKEFPYQPRR